MSSTWIGDKTIESILWGSFKQFDDEFSKLLETQAHSHEERLTGFFVEKLCQHGKMAQNSIMKTNTPTRPPWYFSLHYRDMTMTEKTYGADMAFILNANIKDRMARKKNHPSAKQENEYKSLSFPEFYFHQLMVYRL